MKVSTKKKLEKAQIEKLVETLKERFEKNMKRHKGLKWDAIEKRLKGKTSKLWSLYEMERTGGEPDVVGVGKGTGAYIFFDCAAETPKGRRSICYDKQARQARKEHAPEKSAAEIAHDMGIEILAETQYRSLQKLGDFDTKTSSWVLTPANVRKLGGALFCDKRYETVFLYHNGADSYYAVRGFRGALSI